MRATVGRVGTKEFFEAQPEGLGVVFVAREVIGAGEDDGPAEAADFPKGLNIGTTGELCGGSAPMFERLRRSELKWNGIGAEKTDLAAKNLIGFAGQVGGAGFEDLSEAGAAGRVEEGLEAVVAGGGGEGSGGGEQAQEAAAQLELIPGVEEGRAQAELAQGFKGRAHGGGRIRRHLTILA